MTEGKKDRFSLQFVNVFFKKYTKCEHYKGVHMYVLCIDQTLVSPPRKTVRTLSLRGKQTTPVQIQNQHNEIVRYLSVCISLVAIISIHSCWLSQVSIKKDSSIIQSCSQIQSNYGCCFCSNLRNLYHCTYDQMFPRQSKYIYLIDTSMSIHVSHWKHWTKMNSIVISQLDQ